MGNALSVRQDDLGPLLQPAEGLDDSRSFPEGKQPRDVRKEKVLDGRCLFHAGKLGKPVEACCGKDPGVREGRVHAGDVARQAAERNDHDLPAQQLLRRLRFSYVSRPFHALQPSNVMVTVYDA